MNKERFILRILTQRSASLLFHTGTEEQKMGEINWENKRVIEQLILLLSEGERAVDWEIQDPERLFTKAGDNNHAQ